MDNLSQKLIPLERYPCSSSLRNIRLAWQYTKRIQQHQIRGAPPHDSRHRGHIPLQFRQASLLYPSPETLLTSDRDIASPVITLNIGPSSVIFHAYEASLCRIPFFRAALQGEFREAAEKKVSLPEEDPEVFCALLEHLYTGSYTYTYDPSSTTMVDKAPRADLAEGFYHVLVYAVGSRYDWQPLVSDAVHNFLVVLPKLQGMDVVRLWKAGYESGLTVDVCAGERRLKAFEKVLPGLLKGVLAADAAEMEIAVAEFPALAIDFMKLLVAGSEEYEITGE